MKQKVYTFLSGGKIDTLEAFNAIHPPPGTSGILPQNNLASENIKTDNISVQIPVQIPESGPSDAKPDAALSTIKALSYSATPTSNNEWGNDSLDPEWDITTSKDPEDGTKDDDPEDEDPEEDSDEEDDYFNIIIELLRKIDRNTRKRKKKKRKKHGGRKTKKRKSRRRTKRKTKR